MRPQIYLFKASLSLLSLVSLLIVSQSLATDAAQNNHPANSKQDEHSLNNHKESGKIGSSSQLATTTAAAGSVSGPRPARHLQEGPKTLIDLSYLLHNGTLHWPQNSGFQYTIRVNEDRRSPSGDQYYIKSDGIVMAIHSGTHLDSPRHFSKDGWSVDQIPLERLIDVPVTVIDLSDKIKNNRSYSFIKDDFINTKTKESLVQAKSVVLVYTGISASWDQGPKAYFGTDSKNISEMKTPGFSREAAQYLVERQVYGVGLDAPSADSSDRHGPQEQFDPQAHTVFNTNNIYILENVSFKLKELLSQPAARLTIAPLAIQNGSGSPVRLVAIVGHDECHCSSTNFATSLMAYSAPTTMTITIAAISYLVALRGLTLSRSS